MGTSPSAKLFYGYTQPVDEYGEPVENDGDSSPWDNTYGIDDTQTCTVDIFGYGGNLIHFLAVKESVHESEWSSDCELRQIDFKVKRTWDNQLQQAIKEIGLDIENQTPKWHLVSLYF